MQPRAKVALIGGIAGSIVSGLYAYVIATQVLTAYSESILSSVNDVFWQCGEVYGRCQEDLLQKANAARSFQSNEHLAALIIAGFIGGLVLLAAPALIMGLSNKRSAIPERPYPSTLASWSRQRREFLYELDWLASLRTHGEISDDALRRRRTAAIKRMRRSKQEQ